MSPSYNYTTTRSQNCGCESEQNVCGCQQDNCEQNVCGCQQDNNEQNVCGCQQDNCEQNVCGCQQDNCEQNVCGCQQDNFCSDCAAGLFGVLQLLSNACFSPLIDFARFAFVTDHFVLGSSLSCPDEVSAPYDNLTGPLEGELTDVSAESCRRLGVSGQIYYPQPVCAIGCCQDGPGFTAAELSLCSIRAIAFGVIEEPVPVPANADVPSRFQRARSLLFQALHPGSPVRIITDRPSPFEAARSMTCSDLDCRRTISLTAGPLLLGNVIMLGKIGDVYVLANDEDERFYFVCADSIDFVG